MPDYVIVEGDMAVFLPAFGTAVVIVQPGVMRGSGKSTLSGKKICLEGDEGQLSVPGCIYMTSQHSIPGVGTLKIESLAGDQKSKKTKSGKKAIIIKGSTFNAKFEVQTPAQDPSTIPTQGAATPDASPQYSGKGNFQTSNVKWKVS
jgi:hypothetical protein